MVEGGKTCPRGKYKAREGRKKKASFGGREKGRKGGEKKETNKLLHAGGDKRIPKIPKRKRKEFCCFACMGR